MSRPLSIINHQSTYSLSDGLIRSLKNACTVLVVFTSLFGIGALMLTIGIDWIDFPDLSSNSEEVALSAADKVDKGVTILVNNSAGAFSAIIDIAIETGFSVILFLKLKRLLSSLHQQPTASNIAIGLREIATLVLVWPVTALAGQLLGGCVSRLYSDDFIVMLNPNFPMLAIGIALLIGGLATQKLALAEKELESLV
ncbi:hypothetical protein [Pseudomonas canadensis]|uniref:hypothetical protein n=1 Tax=Pseudomonas canadensis TaxID=915099 RepID=UPI003B9E4379